jgi:CHAT domain-containing protein
LRATALKGESPLLRSGIALAGANQPSTNNSTDDDGYLTALEIAQLDWKGTELVVISACESGKGDIQAGEGVYGLKRAIAVAGARSSLLSLWKVDDQATAAFMESFYTKLKAGQPRAQALALTQQQFRQSSNPTWRHPYVWAAFQLSGDWTPLRW